MTTSEGVAQGKWCPFMRVALVEGMSANRTASMGTGSYADISEETRCLASGCMMWRWSPMLKGEGYCGLAGTPVGDGAALPVVP